VKRLSRRFPALSAGFTLMEVMVVIILIAILAVVAVVKWPGNVKEEAAARELVTAFRYAQHLAMTRTYSGPSSAWGIFPAGSRYTVRRADGSGTVGPEYQDRPLLGDPAITLTGPEVRFNGAGTPITSLGAPLSDADPRTFVINGTKQLTFCSETGFIQEGGQCP